MILSKLEFIVKMRVRGVEEPASQNAETGSWGRNTNADADADTNTNTNAGANAKQIYLGGVSGRRLVIESRVSFICALAGYKS